MTTDVYCWLLEQQLVNPKQVLWAASPTTFTQDAWAAMRFNTKAEAETFATRVGLDSPLWVATDHIFIHSCREAI